MKPTPLHLIVSRLKRMPLGLQIEFLRGLIKLERPYSIRRNELESLLRGKLIRQIRKENRSAA